MRIVFFIALSFICFVSCQKKEKEKAVEVTTVVIKPETIPVVIDFVGVAHSSHPVEIWSRVEGYLKHIDYVEGSFVKEGDLLFEIDTRSFENIVNEAQANVEREKAGLSSAQKTVDRYKILYGQKAASKKDLDDATGQLQAEQAAVAMYEAKLEEAMLNLSYTHITSPISGLSTSSKYREGTLINPGVNGLLTTVSVVDPIWVVVNVSDYYFLISEQEISKGELVIPENYKFDVTLTLADGSKYPYTGKVSFVSPVLDPNTGTLSARAVFPNPDGLLKPGQFVRAHARGAQRPNAIVVPQKSVQQGAKGRFVYVVNSQNHAEMRYVETGNWFEEDWIIKSGLKKGDVVIVDGVNKVKNGTVIKVKK